MDSTGALWVLQVQDLVSRLFDAHAETVFSHEPEDESRPALDSGS